MKGKWSPGKITAVVIGGVAAGMFLLTVFYISLAQIVMGSRYLKLAREMQARADERREQSGENDSRYAERGGDEGDPDGYSSGEKPSSDDKGPSDDGSSDDDDSFFWDDGQENDSGDGKSAEYYDFHNEVRYDLSYQVEFEEYVDMFGSDNVLLSMKYPVVSGDDPERLKGVNRAVRKEFDEVSEYVESLVEEIGPDVSFFFEGECYVTWMDEEILSIAYVEHGYLDGDPYESYVVSVNMDMESGMALTNSQMLNIDDDFSVDFRNRSERQNGEVSYLYNFTDQEITDLLTDDGSLIIFYTPLGMEVGFNYYYGNGWVTVTYRDYEKYRRHF